MHKKLADLASQCDLLALNATLEAARSGNAHAEHAQQAASLQSLALKLRDLQRQEACSPDADGLLQKLQQRLELFSARQRDITALANTIAADARRATSALQLEDVESKVVVYSKHRARELRAQQERIDQLQQELQLAVENDRVMLESAAAALGARLCEPRAQAQASRSGSIKLAGPL